MEYKLDKIDIKNIIHETIDCHKCKKISNNITSVCDNDCGNQYCKECVLLDQTCDYCGKDQCYYCGGSVIITCCCNMAVCLQCILCDTEDKFIFCNLHKNITCSECSNKDCIPNKNENLYGKILYDEDFRELVDPQMDKELLELFRTEWRHPW